MTTSLPAGSERDRARAVAAEVVRMSAEAGVALDHRLAIWPLAGGRPPASAAASSPRAGGSAAGPQGRLGRALEEATGEAHRKALGLHVTPSWLADHLVGLAMVSGGAVRTSVADDGEGWPTVCDPTCGGGAFLVAAARRLDAQGADRRQIVRHLLWGADVDRVGLAAAEAALALWAGEPPPPGRLVVSDPLRADGTVWPEAPTGGFDVVVGNPPFQSQLGRATARDAADRRRLRRRFGAAVRAYTDTAWLFLLLGCELARPGGRVVLVQPESVVAARDAGAVRDAVDRLADLRELWLDDGRVFSAAVRVCAPVLERRPEDPAAAIGPGVGRSVGQRRSGAPDGSAGSDEPAAGAAPAPGESGGPWGVLWAAALDLPVVELGPGPTVGERATIVAGFRDQYYGLIDAVRELGPDEQADGAAQLVTSGAVDWAACTWGERPVRFAKRRWRAPVVDPGLLADQAPAAARRWVERTRVPKLVVATQTRVVEAAVDTAGTWVPSVPAVAAVPGPGLGLWHLAAAILSPAATAWLVRRAAGTALEREALKVAAPDLAALPLPPLGDAWDAASGALAAYAAGPEPGALGEYIAAIGRAYGTPTTLDRWWRERAGSVVRSGWQDG